MNELQPDASAVSFVSGGPKSYGIKTCSGRVKLVVKGLNMKRFSNELTYDKFRELVLEQCKSIPDEKGGRAFQPESSKVLLTEPDKMWANSIKGSITVKPLRKIFRTNYTKRRLMLDEDGYFTKSVPFGYVD